MNISEQLDILKKVPIEAFEYNFEYTNDDGEQYFLMNGKELDVLVEKLDAIPNLGSVINDFHASRYFLVPEGDFINGYSLETRKSLEEILANLKTSVRAIKLYLESYLRRDNENSFKIRCPEVNNFEDLGKVMNELKITFSIPIADSKETQPLTIERVESGSFWMYVIGGTVGVQLVGGIVWAAAVLRKKHSEADFVKQQVEGYKLENNQKKILFDAQNEMLKEVIKSEALHLENQFYESPNSDPERTNRLILAIKTCQDLIDRNAQIRPSLTAAEEVSNLFPNFQNLNLIESQIKKIEEHSKN